MSHCPQDGAARYCAVLGSRCAGRVGQLSEFSQRAAELRELGQQTRVAARRIGALADLRWQSGAADRFRSGVHEEARAQLSLADTLEEVAAAFDLVDVVADAQADVR